MKEYVLCYAESIDAPYIDLVVFMDKTNPPWQIGKLNLPGGKIEPGETAVQAAVRELREETDLKAELTMCEAKGVMHGLDWVVHVVLCPFYGPFKIGYVGDECPLVLNLSQALEFGSRILPELRVIIPLCISRQSWQMIVNKDRNLFNYVLQVG